MQSMGFRSDINFLRAIAVVLVVVFHFSNVALPGGFVGVDIFFAISGYLMTGIIFSQIQKQRFSLLSFYLARAKRIIPALSVMVLSVLVYAWFYLFDVEFNWIPIFPRSDSNHAFLPIAWKTVHRWHLR